jgi:zinc finger protein
VQSFTAPEPDPQIEVEEYDRTEEEMEDLGLNDIKTDGYEEEQQAKDDEVEKAKRFLEKTTGAKLDGEAAAESS